MAKKKPVSSGTIRGYTCPKINPLLGICQLTQGRCQEKNPHKCELLGESSIPVKKSEPKIGKEETPKLHKKDDIPSRPRFFTIEEQLRELGVSEDKITQALDKREIQVEVQDVILRGEPGYTEPRPETQAVDPLMLEGRNYAIEFNDNLGRLCHICHRGHWWRYGPPNPSKWICDYCHPSLITPSRSIYPRQDGTVIKCEIHNEPYLQREVRKYAPEDF